MGAQTGFSDSYWMGYLADTVAAASVAREPQPILRHALKEFMAGNAGHPIMAHLKDTLEEKRWIVFVRGVSGEGDIYGVYGSEASAQKKADAVNKRLAQQHPDSDAWAYVMPLWRDDAARQMVSRAT